MCPQALDAADAALGTLLLLLQGSTHLQRKLEASNCTAAPTAAAAACSPPLDGSTCPRNGACRLSHGSRSGNDRGKNSQQQGADRALHGRRRLPGWPLGSAAATAFATLHSATIFVTILTSLTPLLSSDAGGVLAAVGAGRLPHSAGRARAVQPYRHGRGAGGAPRQLRQPRCVRVLVCMW